MNLDHLRYFKTLFELGNRNEAAQHLAITPSTLSLAISKLESEVGTPLFEKTRGSVKSTEEGRVFYEYVTTALRFLDNGLSLIQEKPKEGGIQKQINIGAVYSVQDKDWSHIINQFRSKTHGEVQINITQSSTPALLSEIKRGLIDLAFTGTMGPDPEITFYPCWSQEACLVVNRRHPFAFRNKISLQELAGHYLVSYALTGPLGAELTKLIQGYDLSIDYLYSDEITLASLVAGNPDIMAIACRSWLLDSYCNEVNLIKLTEAPPAFHQMYLCSKAGINQRGAVATFLEIAQQYCSSMNHVSS